MSTSPIKIFFRPAYRKFLSLLPPKLHVQLDYLRAHGRLPNLENPQCYTEKIVWRMLVDRDPRFPDLADKIKVKDYIGGKFGWKYVIPNLKIYDGVDEMDFDAPPLNNPPYVIKCNHGCAMNIFVRRDDGSFDPERIKKKLRTFMATDYARVAHEWAYSQIERKILVEPLIWELGGAPVDYKLYIFGGRLLGTQVIVDRTAIPRCNMFDRDWKRMPFQIAYTEYKGEIARPAVWDEMVALAENIGRDFAHVRVDLYAVDDVVRVGELTLYTMGGHSVFTPKEWDWIFGSHWREPAFGQPLPPVEVAFGDRVAALLRPVKAALRPFYYRLLSLFPPRTHIMLDFLRAHKRLPDLKNPQTFNEKIAWRKLYDRDPRYPALVDKIKAKTFIAEKFGGDLIIPTLAVYDSPDRMDFTKSPLNAPPYVIKVNHSSGMNIFVRKDDGSFDPKKIRRRLARFLAFDHAKVAEEWAYSRVERKIMVEPYIETPEGYLPDFRFHVFGGRVFAVETVVDLHGARRRENMYNRDWNLLNVVHGRYPRYREPLPRPAQLDRMIEIAETAGRDFSYLRVDLYEIGGAIKFSELTFYPGGGNDPFSPRAWDALFGHQWKIAQR